MGLMIEALRRSPILNLIVLVSIGVILSIPPNLWVTIIATAGGFILPEILIWVVLAIITVLTVGAASPSVAARGTALVAKLANFARKIPDAGKILKTLFEFLQGIVTKLSGFIQKLMQSIREAARVAHTQVLWRFRSAAYWQRRVQELRRLQGPTGHVIERHGPNVLLGELIERVLTGKLPGGGTGPVPRRASKFNTKADMIRSLDHAMSKAEWRAFVDDTSNLRDDFDFPISELFGEKALSRFRGVERIGSKNNPEGTKRFYPQLIKVFLYRETDGGPVFLKTMYPGI